MPWALRAQQLLATDWGVSADVWSATSWTELRRDALAAESHNLLHPSEPARVPYVTSVLSDAPGPAVAVSDWMRAVPDQIARWVPGPYTSLGTDGFGFSDTRPAARRFFHVDAESITLAVLSELARSGEADRSLPAQAIARYKLDLPVSEGLLARGGDTAPGDTTPGAAGTRPTSRVERAMGMVTDRDARQWLASWHSG